jgi:ferredoxin--NADP+ reductase
MDEGSLRSCEESNQVKTNVKVLQNWAIRDPRGAERRLHLHFLHSPVEILGEDRVTGFRTERMELDGDGGVRGTGEYVDHEVQAVYRAIGYLGSPLADLPFDEERGVVPNTGGRVLDLDENHIDGVYATGWIKRGPVGLIGHTKGDALETVTNLVADRESFTPAAEPDPVAFRSLLEERGVDYTTWEGWQRIEAREEELGAERGRKRLKLRSREEQTSIARQV